MLSWILLIPTLSIGSPSDVDSLKYQVHELRNEVRELRKTASARSQQRETELIQLVSDVLADTDTRTNLLHAGWDGKFFIHSADDSLRLNITGHIQTRFLYNHQERTPGIDSHRSGFEMRRAKLEMSGYVVDSSWRYRVRLAFNRGDGTANLEDAHLIKKLGDGWKLRVGQFKAPFYREHNISSKRQLAVERSLVSNAFSQGRTQGIELSWRGERIGFSTSLNDGFDGQNTAVLSDDVEFAFTSRVEYLAAGNWDHFEDFTSWPDDVDLAVMFGAAAHVQTTKMHTPAGSNDLLLSWTVDGSIESAGKNIFVALVGRHVDELGLDQFGVVVQGGLFVAPEWELFGRYEWADTDTPGVKNLSIITIGINRYFSKHQLKWTTDLGYGINSIGDPFAFGGGGWRADPAGREGQFVIRTQLQFLY